MAFGRALFFLIINQPFKPRPRAFQQQRQAFIQTTTAVFRGRYAVETYQRMQAQA
ncbi:hypothetical protein PssB301D_02719 [Pseudomonas syringae pv. syringae str. B301D-R]|nr:hypothetical protein PssB301D_02719 [Pseudomonas syringae pv. syringae str. B301D-R]